MKASRDRSEQFIAGAVQSATPPPGILSTGLFLRSIIFLLTAIQSYTTPSFCTTIHDIWKVTRSPPSQSKYGWRRICYRHILSVPANATCRSTGPVFVTAWSGYWKYRIYYSRTGKHIPATSTNGFRTGRNGPEACTYFSYANFKDWREYRWYRDKCGRCTKRVIEILRASDE